MHVLKPHNTYMINEVASRLNSENHVFLQSPGRAQGTEAWWCGARWILLQVTTHIMHIQTH